MLTPNQKRVLDFLRDYFAENGYMPSYDEICTSLFFKSHGSVAQYLDALEQKNYIIRGKGHRQIFLLLKEQSNDVL